jgi:hypothetical protein
VLSFGGFCRANTVFPAAEVAIPWEMSFALGKELGKMKDVCSSPEV